MSEKPWVDLAAFRYCPACGVAGLDAFVVNGRRCGSCGFEFFENVAAAVAVLIRNGSGEGLFTVREKDPGSGLLDLPGGFVDPGEGVEVAARREILEELGIELGDLAYAGSAPNRYAYKGVVYATADVFFTAGLPEGAKVAALDAIAGFEWRAISGVRDEEIAFDSIRAFLAGMRRADFAE